MYKFVDDLTSDVMFIAEGETLEKAILEASRALFDVVCQREKVGKGETVDITAEGEGEKDLVHEWLSVLLTESDAEEIFFSDFEVKVEKKGNKLVATGKAWGEPYSQEKSGTVVKGVTYYNFKVEKTGEGYKISVVVDI